MKLVTGIAVAVALITAGFLFFYSSVLFSPSQQAQQSSGINLYANGTYGISFAYPASYLVAEGERGTVSRPHYAIVLTHEDDIEPPFGGEGPTTITIDIFPSAGKTLDQWIATTPESNVTLGSGELTDTTVNGVAAKTYRWSGLYEGESTVFMHQENIVMLSVTYLTPEDTIVADYTELRAQMQLSR